MNSSIFTSATEVLISIFAILYAISIHEFGHAFVAYLNGDDTAKRVGRMTINPLHHIDPFGLIAMFLVHFGWAKPVPVDPRNYKNYKLGNITVSLAGVFFNIVSAIVFFIISNNVDTSAFGNLFTLLVIYNIGFASFNILPIPPLDGWSLISTFVPDRYSYKVYQMERYSMMILLILVVTGIYRYILNPVFNFMLSIVMMFG